MAQPTPAAGEAVTPDSNPADAFNDIAAEMLGDDTPEEEEQQPEAEPEGDEPEIEADDEPELGEEDDEPELPAIDPPHSLTAEEKEIFKGLPREAQEFTSRRIGELEKGFQSKAQEAAQAREAARTEALQFATQLKAETVQHLEQYAKQLEVRPPNAALLRADPDAYAQQLEVYQHYTAQREQAQREADQARREHEQYQAALQQHEAAQFRQRLQAELPEAYLPDGQNNVEFINTLAATAKALGYDDNSINTASVEELKALKVVSEMKAKADKYDAAMKKKMERVRAGKSPPPIAKPGVPRGPDASRKAKADQAWQTAQTAKSRTAKDEALATWMENSGWL